MMSSSLTAAKLRIEGIVWGSPYVELTDNSAIQSSAGYTAAIEYKGKGYFSGKSHSFKAALSHNGKSLQTYEGQWTGVSHIGGSKGPVFLDTSAPKEEVVVKPIAEQSEWESRRLWENVAKGIRSGNFDEASKDKSRIEVGVAEFMCEYGLMLRTNSVSAERMSRQRARHGSWSGSSMSSRTKTTDNSPICCTTS